MLTFLFAQKTKRKQKTHPPKRNTQDKTKTTKNKQTTLAIITVALTATINTDAKGLEVRLNKEELLHYDYLEVWITIPAKSGEENMKESAFHLSLLRDGGVIPDMLGREKIFPKQVGKHLVFLYIPNYGIRDGMYEVVIFSNDVEVFRKGVVFLSRQQLKLKEPLKVLTFEDNTSILKLFPTGRKTTYETVAEEIYKIMKKSGLNTFMMLGGQTTYLKDKKNVWYPVVTSNLNILKYLKRKGIQTGAYVMCFLTLGQTRENMFRGYFPNLVFHNGRLYRDYKYTSIASEKRVNDIVEALTYLGGRDYIDFLGLDFIRVGDFGGYELVHSFVSEICSKLCISSLSNLSCAGRSDKDIERFAKIASKDQKLVRLFRWYQAVRVSRVIKKIKDELRRRGIEKPLVAFMLGWNAGREHGQDLFMFRDAGIDYAFYMLYEFYSDAMFEKAGEYYLRHVYNLDTNIVFGNIIDSPLNRGARGPLETFSDRLKKFVTYYSYFTPNGFFFHDLYRLYFGRTGPFTREKWLERIRETVEFIDNTTFFSSNYARTHPW